MLLANLAPREDYQTVTIRIFAPAAAGEAYPVELSVLRWRIFRAVFFSIDQASLNAQTADPKAYGLALGRGAVRGSGAGKAYGETVAAVQGRSEGLRIGSRSIHPSCRGFTGSASTTPWQANGTPWAARRRRLSRAMCRPSSGTARPGHGAPFALAGSDRSPKNLDSFSWTPSQTKQDSHC